MDTGEKMNAVMLEFPDWIPKQAWFDYVEHRKAKRAKITPRAAELIVRKLGRFKEQGQDIEQVINQSIENGWTGIFPLAVTVLSTKVTSGQLQNLKPVNCYECSDPATDHGRCTRHAESNRSYLRSVGK